MARAEERVPGDAGTLGVAIRGWGLGLVDGIDEVVGVGWAATAWAAVTTATGAAGLAGTTLRVRSTGAALRTEAF